MTISRSQSEIRLNQRPSVCVCVLRQTHNSKWWQLLACLQYLGAKSVPALSLPFTLPHHTHRWQDCCHRGLLYFGTARQLPWNQVNCSSPVLPPTLKCCTSNACSIIYHCRSHSLYLKPVSYNRKAPVWFRSHPTHPLWSHDPITLACFPYFNITLFSSCLLPQTTHTHTHKHNSVVEY